MPEDKKNQHKGKSDAKEQRKPRQGRQKSGPAKSFYPPPGEKKTEEPKVPQKPVYEDPGPEFYKNLKRETDEILKITEEANSKYKKKEIQSNWSKYEMPVESYEDIEQQENMGADYEQLVQMPMSVGGHFQFKHEKSWDVSTSPSLYDKYFEINMKNLANAVCTIPFYERNNVEKDIFSDTDILNMDKRAIKYKQTYYNRKSTITPELQAFITEADDMDSRNVESVGVNNDKIVDENLSGFSVTDNEEIDLQLQNKKVDVILDNEIRKTTQAVIHTQKVVKIIDDIDDLILEDPPGREGASSSNAEAKDNAVPSVMSANKATEKETEGNYKTLKPEESKNPIIESPTDLEKWLDDFLEG